MKKMIFSLVTLLITTMPSTAQNYKNSRYYNPTTGHLEYNQRNGNNWRGDNVFNRNEPYFGFRIGPTFSYVNSDDSRLDGGNWQSGLNVGAVVGIPLTDRQPLYLETGLFYNEKGGKKNLSSGKKMTYDLNYLEIPVVLKYRYHVDSHLTIEPQVGGYFGIGVSGKIKNFEDREAEKSFNKSNFRRTDGGIRLGCGIGYDMFYADLTYDIGLANICHDTFDTSHNGALTLNIGVNF